MAIVHLVGLSGYESAVVARGALEGLADVDLVVADAAVAAQARRSLPDRPVRSVEPGAAVSLVMEAVRSGQTVVRVMAGDPLGSTHGLAEARSLAAAGIRFRVRPAPGYITLALGAAGVGWDPVEGLAAMEVADPSATDWSRIPPGMPLALALEARATPAAIRGLISAGWDDTMPALLVVRPGTPSQRTREGSLAELMGAGPAHGGADAVLAVGGYVRRRGALEWFERRPLFGVRAVVTRPREQAEIFAGRLGELGADTLVFPAIRIVAPADPVPLRTAVDSLGEYDWLVFTSANGVKWFWQALLGAGRDARALAGLRVICIGPVTAATLAERGVQADLVPEEFVAEAVLEAMAESGALEGRRVLLPRAQEARDVLPRGLEARGARVDVVAAYRSVPDTEGGSAVRAWLEDGEGAAVLTFTSSSTVRNFVAAVGADVPAVAAAIGPITAATARELGFDVVVEAGDYTMDGLTAALCDHYGQRQPGRRARSSE